MNLQKILVLFYSTVIFLFVFYVVYLGSALEKRNISIGPQIRFFKTFYLPESVLDLCEILTTVFK